MFVFLHNVCANKHDDRHNAGMCVRCDKPMPDDAPNGGPDSASHKECREKGIWLGYSGP